MDHSITFCALRFCALRSVLSVAALLFSILVSAPPVHATWVEEAQQNGFTLKKVVSDTIVNTGQTFSYTVYFSIPAGATNVRITDAIPGVLEFLGASYTSPCGTPDTVVAPAINAMGGTYSLFWASVPSGCSGSFTVTVRFPNGTTCNGVSARNRVCVTGKLGPTGVDLCTPFVTTTARAVEPWNINKYIIGAAYQGGTCPYATGDSVVTYQINVYKDVGTTGQLNLVNGVVTDVLPTGATLQSSSCVATQSGNTITWNVGALSATSMYNAVWCTISVLYPRALFPNGSTIQNQAVLTGQTGAAANPCGNIADSSNRTCVEIKSISSATLSKWVYTNGQPGCVGKYLVYICNNGTTPIASFTVTDTVPAPLTTLSVGAVTAGLNVAFTGGNIFTATSTSALAPGQCRYFEINFTIPLTATVGSAITNCAWFTAGAGIPPIKACNTFTVAAPAPTVCLWKEVCPTPPSSYSPGSVFRYRLRIQNIGGQPLSGTTLTDVLNPNLTYVGNPSYYTGTSWSAPCQTTSNWAGVALAYNAGTNTVSATLPAIPAVCQNIFYLSCGMYGTGGVPYYFIEFDVRVVDTTALGNIPNLFTISGGTLTGTATSNTVYVTVGGTAGFTLQKGVKKSGSGPYSASATTTAGGSVAYQLKMTVAPGSVALRHTTFADLLPRDFPSNPDKLILGPCTNRGSAFDVSWSSAITSSPSATAYANPLSFAAVNNFAPTGSPGNMFVGGCGTSGTWSAGLSAGAKNPGYYFGSAPIGAGFSATSEFNALVSATAKYQDSACNTFAANAAVRHLISSSLITDQKIGQLESGTACISIAKEGCLDSLKATIACAGLDANGYQQYSISVSGWNANTAGVLMMSSTDGTFSPATFPVSSGSFSFSTTFTDVPPVTGMVTMKFTLVANGIVVCRDSLLRDLPPCNVGEPEDCCKAFFNKVDNIKLTYNNAGNVNMTATITAGPSPIKKFVATIVSVQRRQVCKNFAQPWQRAFGDIIGGSLTSALSPGPLLLQLYSRQAQWGTGECLPFDGGVGLQLKMIFPPVPGPKCIDTLIFAIRYSFTDCKCVTCETVVYDTLVRKYVFRPWDNPNIGIGVGFGRPTNAKAGDAVQSDTAASTALVMSNNNDGTLWVVNPAEPGNELTVRGAEVTSDNVPLTRMVSGSDTGIIAGKTGFIAFDGPPGSTVAVNLTFDNTNSLLQFPVDVRYLFTVGNDPEQQYSEVLRYVARVPGAAPDVVASDPTKPLNVKSYAVYFANGNGYNEPVYSFRIRSTGTARILAIGPAGTDATVALLVPIAQTDGSYMVSAVEQGITGVAPSAEVRPIYITLSDVDGVVPFDFETYDVSGQPISNGTFEISDPISGVEGGSGASSDVRLRVYPNPANSSSTLSVYLDRWMNNVQISILDVQGRHVMSILNESLNSGSHIVPVQIGSLQAGTYFVVLRTPTGVISQPMTVVR